MPLWCHGLHHLPLPSSLSEDTFYGPDCLCPQEVTLRGVAPGKGRAPVVGTLSSHLRVPFPLQKPHGEVKVMSPEVGIQVTVTEGHSARTFRQAAVLVAAVARLRRQPRRDFADSDLGDLLDEIFGMDK